MPPETLEGVIERVTYRSDESGYSVLRVKPNSQRLNVAVNLKAAGGVITVIGTLPELQPGESVRFKGGWINNKDYGFQFKAENVEQMAPATLEGLRRFLGSGMIAGIGEVIAKRIVDHFGMSALDVLDHSPERMGEVPGIGKQRVGQIKEGWARHRKIKEVMIFLQSHNVSTELATRIYAKYEDASIEKVLANPYALARDIRGIGFRSADKIARNLGLPEDAPERVAAGLTFALQTLEDDGHVLAPRIIAVETAAELLEVPAEMCDAAVDRLVRTDEVRLDTLPLDLDAEPPTPVEVLYLPWQHASERGAARRLKEMAHFPNSRLKATRLADWDEFFATLAAEEKRTLSEQQQSAVRATLTHKVNVLTGGPGTGKTTTLRATIRALEAIGAKYALASPTGRAAKRLSEATGRPAQTIHRLLGYSPKESGFAHNETRPLGVDILIVDESSMLDLQLFYSVLKALTVETHLLLVGDVDQLPSVGAGDVLHDVIRSGVAHVTRLNAIFRQANTSLIITNAHRVNEGRLPDLSNQGEDFFVFTADETDEVGDLLVDVVQNRIPRRFGLNPIEDVQVLTPMYRGVVGINALNERLQTVLNPPGRLAERRTGGRVLRVGDKVMQTRNNYNKDVFNGDIGRIHSINHTDQFVRVAMDGRLVDYSQSEEHELVHAYAVSVHRSQGSEYPAVVIPMVTQHYMMLQRNLLYTAITRAKQLVVLVGSRRAIAIAVNNNRVSQRYSGLAWRLMH